MDPRHKHARELGTGPDLQAQAAAHDFEYEEGRPTKEGVKSGVRGAAGEAADAAKRAQHDAVGALRGGGTNVESAAGAAKERAGEAAEAAKGKATDLKASAAQAANDVARSLRSERESAMTATERAEGRAKAEADELSAKMHEAGGAVTDKVHEAQHGAVHAMRETGATIAESLDTVAAKASGAVEAAKEKLGLGEK